MNRVGATYSSVGKELRLRRILDPKGSVVFAFDHGVEHGPRDFNEDTINAERVIARVVEAGVDAVMLTPGLARITSRAWMGKASLIVKITGKTLLRPADERLVQSPFGSLDEAIALGADAVAMTVYWGSPYEDVMLERWFNVKSIAESYGIPLLQLAYPRGPSIENMYDVEVVMYGARAAAESGADIIKTYYTGSAETFKKVVESANGIPVLMSGGKLRSKPEDFLKDLASVMEAGGAGAVVGRNIFQSGDITGMTKAVVSVIKDRVDPGDAAKRYLGRTA